MSVHAFEAMCTPKNVAVFESTGVLTANELHARQEIMMEDFCKTVRIEANVSALDIS